MEREVLNQVNKEDMYTMHWSDISEHEEFKKGLKKYPKSLHKEENSKTNKQKTQYIQFSSVVAETSTQETKHHTRRVGELRLIYTGRPRGVNTPSSEPQTKGLQSFYRQIIVDNTSC